VPPTKGKLTTKQKIFVECYSGNATEAALKAGYSKKTAAFIGAENLRKPQIIEAISSREKKISSVRIADRQERQSFWTSVLRDSEEDMKNRLKAAELLGRSEGDFLDRIGGPNGEAILPQLILRGKLSRGWASRGTLAVDAPRLEGLTKRLPLLIQT
jgi:phage terminase small subunit